MAAKLSQLTETRLRAKHAMLILEARIAQADGDRDLAYRLAMEVRRTTAELQIRMMVAA